MTKKIYHSILYTSLTVLLTTLAITVATLYHYFQNLQETQLNTELTLAKQGVEKSGQTYLENLPQGDLRLTLVGKDGTVLGDTKADAATMENHQNREEIRQALQTGQGQSQRYSSTLTQKTIYKATKLQNGNILRAGISQTTIIALIQGIIPYLALAIILSALLSRHLAEQLSKKIITPLEQIDLDHPLENDTYQELTPILTKIHKQHKQIDQQLIKLKQKNDEFNHIVGNIKESLILLDSQDKILSINKTALRIHNLENPPIGTPYLEIDRTHQTNQAIREAKQNGHSTIKEQKHGRTYQSNISSIQTNGQHTGTVILTQDITEQAEAEQQRREFTANVSHELKTPLTAIIAGADIIQTGIAKENDIPHFAASIKTEAQRLQTLIDDIIRLSQLDENNQPTPQETINLKTHLQETIRSLEHIAKERNIQVKLQSPDTHLKANPRQLGEITHNLIENAIKYNKEGGTVNITVNNEKNTVKLIVADTGIGIPPEHQDKIFQRFYRVDKSHSKQTGGTGLGLAIVKHAAQTLGAQINLQSHPDHGTTITVTFAAIGSESC